MDEEKQLVTEETATQRTVPGGTQTIVEQRVPDERPVSPATEHGMNVAERVIWFLAGVVIVFVGLRFVLRLLGANPANGFADFIYGVSHVFVAPFLGLFNATNTLTQGRLEFESLIAMLVYVLIAWGIARLITLGKR